MSNTNRRFKEKAYEQLGRVGKAVSSPRRIELLELLSQAPRSVAELAELADMSVANASQHLQTLREARLVDSKRDGNHVIYGLAGPEVASFVVALRSLAEARLVELRAVESDYLDEADVDSVDAEQVWERIDNGEAAVVDVRPQREFEAGHIDGAISMPLDEVNTRLDELPDNRQVVVYCRGPFCTLAADAVRLLRKEGFDAVRLRDSYADWQMRGFERGEHAS